MKYGLFFDTETTGIPDWKSPSGAEHQPHMVQLAAQLCDLDTREVIQSMDVIVRPDGREIPAETTEVHGISTEFAKRVGVPEHLALEMFMALWDACDIRVAHNTTFDNRIIRIALKRYMPDAVSDEEWKDRDGYFCTLQNAKRIMGGKDGHTLGEAYEYFTGKQMDNAHSAMPDTDACREIFFAMRDRGEAAA